MKNRDNYLIGMVAGAVIVYGIAFVLGLSLLIAQIWKG
jgi:hypothetical protein